MFQPLSQESVSSTPRKAALYASCAIHFCGLIALTWFSVFSVSTVQFELMTVHAGAPGPVRKPQPVYAPIPIRNLPRTLSERTQTERPVIEAPRQSESNDTFTPSSV